jgi:hypothetical protein
MNDRQTSRDAKDTRDRKDTKDIKRDNFASIEEALEGAGTTVLSHLGSASDKVNREAAQRHRIEAHLVGDPVEGEHRVYVGPYTAPDDERNSWIYEQEVPEVAADSESRQGEEKRRYNKIDEPRQY